MNTIDAARAWQRPVMTAGGMVAAGYVLMKTEPLTLGHFHACLLFLGVLYVWRGAVDKGGLRELIEAWKRNP